jgi:ATP-dependent DNA helicase PIF1
VPNLAETLTEADMLREAAQQPAPPAPPAPLRSSRPILTAPAIHGTPLTEYNAELAINAFPTLFPTGQADFNAAREKKVDMLEWAGHMLRLHGDRFAQHPRFRYWALNTFLRHKSKKSASWYLTTHRDEREYTVEDIQRMVLDNQADALAQRVSRSGANLEGTKMYWQKTRNELRAMMDDPTCGPPSLFFTCSAADVQWVDLHRLMPTNQPDTQDERVLYKWRLTNLNDNPAIAAQFFVKRWELFFNTVVCKIFKVKDHWWRFEWQHRGSSHIHGFLWLVDAPTVDPPGLAEDVDNAAVAEFVEFWDQHLSTWNPGTPNTAQEVPPARQHPSSWDPTTMSFSKLEYAQMINRFQRHTKCAPGYCLRVNKQTRQLSCRFNYPKELRDISTLVEKLVSKGSRKIWEFLPKRNDTLLNNHLPSFSMGWLGNTDGQPITDADLAVNYAGKYVTKGEPASVSYLSSLKKVIEFLDKDVRSGVVFQKLLSSAIGERDMPAQEVCHILLGEPLHKSSRSHRSICVSQQDSVQLNFEAVRVEHKSIRHHYVARPDDLKDLTLYDFAHHYTFNHKRRGARGAKPFIVYVYPAFSPNTSDPDAFEDYAFARLILHHPHHTHDATELLGNHESWAVAYEEDCVSQGHVHIDSLPTAAPEEEPQGEEEDEDEEDVPDPDADLHPQAAWMLESARRPNQPLLAAISNLGSRDIDSFNWAVNDLSPDVLKSATSWLSDQKTASGAHLMAEGVEVAWQGLQGSQRDIFLAVVAHFRATLSGLRPPPLRLNVDGTAGTGKSFLIAAISTEIKRIALESCMEDPVIRVAPTGIAAFNIQGLTIHAGFRISPKRFAPLSTSSSARLQAEWKKHLLLILDEKSMVGQDLLGKMDSRLSQLKPGESEEPLGGMSALLFGDFAQLPPVCDKPLFSPAGMTPEKMQGKRAYESFTHSVALTHVFRQAGADAESVAFRTALMNLRTYQTTPEDYALLSTRFSDRLPEAERALFSDAMHLYPHKATVISYNFRALAECNQPVVRCPARHAGGAAAVSASEEDAEGLEKEILLAEGAKVMLTQNLWTPQGTVHSYLS